MDGILVVIVAPEPIPTLLWQPVQSEISDGDPVLPPGDPLLYPIDISG